MNFFIFSYVETALVECTPLVSSAPVPMIGNALPASASTPPAVAGTTFYNAFDEANGNSFVWDSRKTCVITNANATDSVDVTFATVNGEINGFERVLEDLVVRVGPLKAAHIGNLPSIFKDGTLVKISIADVAAGDAIGDCKIAVVKVT